MNRWFGPWIAVVVVSIVWAGVGLPADAPPTETGEPLVVFLVRHAEKVDRGPDPDLTPDGLERAEELAHTLRDARIEHVHSSDFVRTRKTAAPVARRYGLELELYDPGDLLPMAEKLRAAGGRHLVVGHSNTTPTLVRLLGGEPGPPIDEEREHDRLYILTVGENGKANTVLMRYGRE